MPFRLHALLLSSIAALPVPLLAQTQSDAGQQIVEDDGADEIVVSAARTRLPLSALPLTIDIIDEQALDRQVTISGSTVDAVSALLPSFSPTREKLSGSGESLRGRSPLYAINGIPQSTPIRDGSRDGYTVDPFFIDRIEVIYGSNALQGIGGTGGVVNQVTVQPPPGDGIGVEALLQGTVADGFDSEALGGKAAALVNYRSGALDATVGGAFERRGVFIDGAGNRIGIDGAQGEIQDSDSWSLFGRIGYQLSGSARLELVANRFELEGNNHYVLVSGDRQLGIPASSARGTTPGDPPANRAELVSLSLTDDDLAGGSFTLQGFYNRTNDIFGGGVFGTFQDPGIGPLGNLFDQSANQSRKLGGKLSYEREVPGLEALTLIGGFDVLFDRTEQSLVQTGRIWVPQTEFRSLAPFVQANLGLADGLIRLAGGVRYEDVKLDVGDFTTLAFYGAQQVSGGSPSFSRALLNGGVVVEPIDGVRAYGSYAEGYTIADVGRILRGISEPGVDVDNFLDLEPVVSNNRELGVEVARGPFTGSATYYWSSSDLGQLLVRGADGIFSVSRQPIDIEGLEINLATRTPLAGLTVSTGYSHVTGGTDGDGDGRNDTDLDGANISPDRLNLTADYRQGPLSARLQGRFYLSRRFEGQNPLNDFGGYALLDAFVGYETAIGQLSLGIQNLTDARYLTYFSDTQGPADNNRFFNGRGRTATLGWRVKL